MTIVTDGAGGESVYTYNRLDLVIRERDPLGHVRRWRWSEAGAPIEHRDGEGRVSLLAYDEFNRLTRDSSPAGGTVQLAYAPLDEQVPLSSPSFGLPVLAMLTTGGVQRFCYDARGQLVEAEDPASRTLRFLRDTRGRETRGNYAGLPFPVRRQAPDGGVLRYEYDGTLNLAALVNEKGERATFARDAAERLVEEIGFDARRQLYRHDASGLLVERQDGAGVTRYVRDATG
ncbi:RHS repeat protein [Sphingomonas sp. PP-CE-1G-424]|uniref:RHS repeat protein n=1 Tax=Sphingomonas sp. PP-CE-1G-424 TaxID=2135658 RepID=UPI00105437D6|nr:RHS repeat protein [Sphingomonas sp. PP-CE-1G-424]TCP70939.1 YD repeat-containing protein [Sphingomonas sp. PP-CE-1G-424]